MFTVDIMGKYKSCRSKEAYKDAKELGFTGSLSDFMDEAEGQAICEWEARDRATAEHFHY